MAVIVIDGPDFLVKLLILIIFALFFVAGALIGFGLLGLIMRYEYKEQRKKRRVLRHYKASEKAMWAEVDKILAQGDEPCQQ